MALPFVEVTDLPSSSALYANVLEPLGLHYLCADREELPPLSSSTLSLSAVTYGAPRHGHEFADVETAVRGTPVLQIREPTQPFQPLKLSSLVVCAPCRAAVAEFQASVQKANPSLVITPLSMKGGVSRVTILDLDGNTMEVIYPPPPGHPLQYTGASGQNGYGRILEWNHDVAPHSPPISSHSPPSMSHRSSSRHSGGGEARSYSIRRSATTTASGWNPMAPPDEESDPPASPRQSSKTSGFNTTTVVGALLAGAAAGAALTYSYNYVSREKMPSPQPEDKNPFASRPSTYSGKSSKSSYYEEPSFPYEDSRSSYGKYPSTKVESYPPSRVEDYPPPELEEYAPRRLTYTNSKDLPSKKPYSGQDIPSRRTNYTDNVDEDEMEGPYTPMARPTHPSIRKLTRSTTSSRASSRDRVVDDYSDTQSRPSSRRVLRPRREDSQDRIPSDGRSSRARTYSEAPVSQAPSIHRRHGSPSRSETPRSRASSVRPMSEVPNSRDLYMERDRQSYAGSRHTVTRQSTYSKSHSQRSRHRDDEESYVSAQSHRSNHTARRVPVDEGEYAVVGGLRQRPSRAPSYAPPLETPLSLVKAAPVYPEAPEVPIPRSRMGRGSSLSSANGVPLPTSNVGSSEDEDSWDDDLVSLAPSDSISCVGIRPGRRRR